jgi:hypothetical protein
LKTRERFPIPVPLVEVHICRSCYIRSYAADGNFKANHLKQKTDDIWLTDGEAFMTNNARYDRHLAEAIETREVIVPISFGSFLFTVSKHSKVQSATGTEPN